MNLKEYISSGIIESYVMGLATQAEKEEFEAMCRQYPEIAEARQQFEIQLEKNLINGGIMPPEHLKESTWQQINIASEAGTGSAVEIAPVKRLNIWKPVAAAAIILLAGASFWAFTLNSKYKSLQSTNVTLSEKLNNANNRLLALQQDAEMMQKPTVKMAALHGTAHAPASFATVYWDTTSKDVYLMINNLPQPASGKQYQLWALINNQPVDLGVIVREEKLLVKMKNVQNAQAFAITLEPKGGSSSPTLDAMYVMGTL